MAALKMFGKESCHLCDEAEALLRGLGVVIEYIDIAGDDALLARYGTRVPVLCLENGTELDWPFDTEQAVLFLRSQGICQAKMEGV